MRGIADAFWKNIASDIVDLRAGDAIHLAAAQSAGFSEIWSNDKRLLQAAPAFGLTGKSV